MVIIILFFPVIILCLDKWLEFLLRSPVFNSILLNNNCNSVFSLYNYLDYVLRILNMGLTLLLSYLLYKLNLNNKKEKERLALFNVKKLLISNLNDIKNTCEDKGVSISEPATFNDINPIMHHLDKEDVKYLKDYVDFVNRIFKKYVSGEDVKNQCNEFSKKYLITNQKGKKEKNEILKTIEKKIDGIEL